MHRSTIGHITLRRAGLAVSTLLTVGLLAGCVDLAAVRQFAKTSAATADYKQVVSDYAREPLRRKQYAPASQATKLDDEAKTRGEQAITLEAAQGILVAYMSALGDLAADELPSIDKEVDGLGTALEKAKFVGEADKSTAAAAGSIAKALGRLALDHWRQAQLAKLIRETDDNVQAVVAGMRDIMLKDFDLALNVEKGAVTSYFIEPLAAAPATQKLAKLLQADRVDDIEARRAKLKAYAEVLAKIGKGHAELRANVGTLDDAALAARLKQYAKDLTTLYKAITA